MKVSIAIDNNLYYQFNFLTGNDMIGEIRARVCTIAGENWERAEWYTIDEAGVIIK